MATLLVRIASALALTGFALFFVGLIPFLGDPTAGTGTMRTAPLSVNRELKGDRFGDHLLDSDFWPTVPRSGLGVQQSEKPNKIPVGCEGSFSPISAPRLAYVYGRCMT